MRLSPREADKLRLHAAAAVAQKRLARSLCLNHTEACALIASQLVELVRDNPGAAVSDMMDTGRRILGRRMVLPGVVHTLHEVQVEATFGDGTKLITVHRPLCTDDGDLRLALHGSGLPVPAVDSFPALQLDALQPRNAPGALHLAPGDIVLNVGRLRQRLRVRNDGDRPVQVGSHYHFAEVNRALCFDRVRARGHRLDIPAGTSVRFEPGESKPVTLVPIAGLGVVSGGNNLDGGSSTSRSTGTEEEEQKEFLVRLSANGFAHCAEVATEGAVPAPCTISRAQYAAAYGPTTGDRVRLGDTDLWLEVERDYAVYGDECVFGGGKVIREGQGQSTLATNDALDLVITNALVVDHSGIFKADIGVRNGLIAGIGKAGNHDCMAGVTPGMTVGAFTEVLAGEGKLLTAGALDTHIHFICPQICEEALSSGITTLIGGGTGPNTGTCATTCTPGPSNIRFMLQATDGIPLNFGFTGKGNCADIEPLRRQVRAGAVGLKLHEDYGTSPAAIDACLRVCDEMDVQATIHTDTLNESGFVEDTINVINGRTIHAYHSEGAGGGHAPDIIKVCSVPHVIPSSTNPTRPYTRNTIDEHLDMLMVCHHLDSNIPEDISFAESRIRGETISAEDLLHDMGAISIISSDSQAMGRVGEVISRTWQTAHKMKEIRGALAITADGRADNDRVKRYIAKYTVNPAIAHGVSHMVGAVKVGLLADLVLWRPEFFGTKPEVVLKGGQVAYAQMGDANASIPTPQPVLGRPMFGAQASAVQASFDPTLLKDGGQDGLESSHNVSTCVAFVSQYALDNGVARAYGLKKRVVAVQSCRSVQKSDMPWNGTLPYINVDPETYEVHVDNALCQVPPADSVCMARGSFMF